MKFSNVSPTKLRLVQSLIITFLTIPCFKVAGEAEQIELTFRNHASASSDREFILYHGRKSKGVTNLYIADINGDNEKAFFGPSVKIIQEAELSPNEEYIIYISGKSYQNGDLALYTADIATKQEKLLVKFENANAKSPTWSPDGKYVLVEARDQSTRTSQLYLINASGSNLQKLETKSEHLVQPKFSPDGKSILAVNRDKNNIGNLVKFSLNDKQQPSQLTNSRDNDIMPTWMPNGKGVVFSRIKEGDNQSDLYYLNVSSLKVTKITDTPNASEYFPTITNDGRTLFYDSFTVSDGSPSSKIRYMELGNY